MLIITHAHYKHQFKLLKKKKELNIDTVYKYLNTLNVEQGILHQPTSWGRLTESEIFVISHMLSVGICKWWTKRLIYEIYWPYQTTHPSTCVDFSDFQWQRFQKKVATHVGFSFFFSLFCSFFCGDEGNCLTVYTFLKRKKKVSF